MITKTKLKKILENNVWTRPIKNKNKFIARLIIKEYHLDIRESQLEDIVEKILYADRQIRLIRNENPKLRGDSEETKKMLEQKAMLELNYIPGERELIKKVKEKV